MKNRIKDIYEMKKSEKYLSNDQILLSTISGVMLSHRNPRKRSIMRDFKYLFHYINENAEQPVSLLFHIGIVIVDAEHILIRRYQLSRYINYPRSSFSHFLTRHRIIKSSIDDIETTINIQKLKNDKFWTAYKITEDSTFNLLLLNYPFLWASRETIQKTIGLANPIISLLQSFQMPNMIEA
ncbi:hypothetical protein TRFO_18154 [Tritrichomonas foetus]|uniref:Uncharacterized protein n=1 Tax=Tritrichomonas foetus TaxID=1144522 RepID=A0A1J4KLI5_9EUKA|nr:hypothetical protein TRFO_18154 [Tritrichomonas foetus]|eukprot:OHT12161.1 hypothetical protein TRFO_18154 [Tritrichomonas foetus]